MSESDERDIERYVVGRRAVAEALAAGTQLEKIFLSYGTDDTPITAIRTAAKKAGMSCAIMDRRKFADLERTLGLARNDAQGVIALRPVRDVLTAAVLLEQALLQSPSPILVAMDGITDPHNLGAIARSAEAVGAAGLLLSAKFSAPVTPVAVKASAGALEHLAVARVQRITEALATAKTMGYRVVGTTIPADHSYDEPVYDGPTILVIGAEGEGLHPRVIAECTTTVHIPMHGNVASLNASVAAGIVLFEMARQRRQPMPTLL